MVLHLPKPIEIVRRSGWSYAVRFWLGQPPDSTPDDIGDLNSVAQLAPIGLPLALPIMLSRDDGNIFLAGQTATIIVPHGQNAYWPVGNFELLWRIFGDDDPTDRYVIRSYPNRSPVKVLEPPGGIQPLPGGPSGIEIPLSFTLGYSPGEVLPGIPLLDLVLISGIGSRFASLSRPTAPVSFTIRRNTVPIGVATMDPATCGIGPVFNGTVTLISDPTTLTPADFIDWVAPGSLDATFLSGAVNLRGG